MTQKEIKRAINNKQWCYLVSRKGNFYTVLEPNKKGETMVFEITEIHPNNKSKSALPVLWLKHGYTDKLLHNYFCINTYVTDSSGCWGRYNPQVKPSEDNKRHVINFDFMLEISIDNKDILITETLKRFFNIID